MDTLNDLLAASDLISLHCALTNDTIQIINTECLQHIKPGKLFIFCSWGFSMLHFLNISLMRWCFFEGAFLVNTGSSQLLDDCAVKQLLIDGTLAGCALDGAEGPQWMEAWVWWIVLGYDAVKECSSEVYYLLSLKLFHEVPLLTAWLLALNHNSSFFQRPLSVFFYMLILLNNDLPRS